MIVTELGRSISTGLTKNRNLFLVDWLAGELRESKAVLVTLVRDFDFPSHRYSCPVACLTLVMLLDPTTQKRACFAGRVLVGVTRGERVSQSMDAVRAKRGILVSFNPFILT
ncbi:MAG: hypothetical protein QGI17_07095 [Arenicellales bacterium]|jgi:hypothetical protein|nr:hypothetical protein [Arenicellales bacterium]